MWKEYCASRATNASVDGIDIIRLQRYRTVVLLDRGIEKLQVKQRITQIIQCNRRIGPQRNCLLIIRSRSVESSSLQLHETEIAERVNRGRINLNCSLEKGFRFLQFVFLQFRNTEQMQCIEVIRQVFVYQEAKRLRFAGSAGLVKPNRFIQGRPRGFPVFFPGPLALKGVRSCSFVHGIPNGESKGNAAHDPETRIRIRG
jgi:hypothetical protein